MEQVEKWKIILSKTTSLLTGWVLLHSHAMGNWWEQLCISHMVKYTIRCESDGRKVPTLWGKYEYRFPRLSQSDGFRCIFLCYGKLMGKPMHVLYDGFCWIPRAMGNWWGDLCISHMMRYTTGWESVGKKHSYCEKSMGTSFSPIPWLLLHFPMLWVVHEETHTMKYFQCAEVYRRMGI